MPDSNVSEIQNTPSKGETPPSVTPAIMNLQESVKAESVANPTGKFSNLLDILCKLNVGFELNDNMWRIL